MSDLEGMCFQGFRSLSPLSLSLSLSLVSRCEIIHIFSFSFFSSERRKGEVFVFCFSFFLYLDVDCCRVGVGCHTPSCVLGRDRATLRGCVHGRSFRHRDRSSLSLLCLFFLLLSFPLSNEFFIIHGSWEKSCQ